MQIGVSSYSYLRLISAGQMSVEDVPAKAKEMGFDVVEFTAFKPPAGQTPLAYADRLRERAEAAGMPVVNYAVGADFLTGSHGDLQAEIERVKAEVDVARKLGATRMRHDATGGYPADHPGPKSFDAALPRLAAGCRAVTAYAADHGITTMVENHGLFCQDSDRVEKLACEVAHPNFGLLVDVGNFICVDEDPGRALGRVLPYARHVHFKDFHLKPGNLASPGEGWRLSRGGNHWRGAIIGHGDVPVGLCARLLQQAGYDGVVSIEFEGMEDPITGIRIGRDNLCRLFGRAN
ncbi:MAG: sugar phosphate isomerase/epimerase family protein [Phycisphaeraceae bacterium]